MSDTVIQVENLGKRYIIGHQPQERYKTLRDAIAAKTGNLINSWRSKSVKGDPQFEEFWALKDVSFEVKQGERVGIIGRNGAGKSTLLKILSRITEPTEGRVRIRGRVASLLEVGTGFHPELTGRENIYLNGAILGMSRAEIRRKFDEIVAFAEVEKFLDTPVKRYSSGMYVRLAFAVAAHLDPEILIVDEVLAVGDAQFQKKCLGKMEDVAEKEGRTVLFVSHNMAAIQKLCRDAVYLDRGQLILYSKVSETLSKYLLDTAIQSNSCLRFREDRIGTGEIWITDIEIRDKQRNIVNQIKSGDYIEIHLIFQKKASYTLKDILVGISLRTQLEIPVFLHHTRLINSNFNDIPYSGRFIFRVGRIPLPPSTYSLTYSVMSNNSYIDHIANALVVSITDGSFYPSGETPPITHGVCLLDASWSIEVMQP